MTWQRVVCRVEVSSDFPRLFATIFMEKCKRGCARPGRLLPLTGRGRVSTFQAPKSLKFLNYAIPPGWAALQPHVNSRIQLLISSGACASCLALARACPAIPRLQCLSFLLVRSARVVCCFLALASCMTLLCAPRGHTKQLCCVLALLILLILATTTDLVERPYVRWTATPPPPPPPPAVISGATSLSAAGPHFYDSIDSQAWTLERDQTVSSKTVKLELEGVVLGLPFITNSSSPDELSAILPGLLDRFRTSTAYAEVPTCSLHSSRYTTLFSSKNNFTAPTRISIAINLHNSAAILPGLSAALLTTVHLLRQHNHTVALSIFENGSTDRTTMMLGDLAAALLAVGINALTIRSPDLLSNYSTVDRIVVLAALRNEALRPLLPSAGNGTILFVNDVVTCASDLLELLHQHELQQAHAVMSTDWWHARTPWHRFTTDLGPKFRDVWVARGINGALSYTFGPRSYAPQFPTNDPIRDLFSTQDNATHARWLHGLPLPVYSGWNGAVAISASVFTRLGLRFRASGAAGWQGGDPQGRLGPWGRLLARPGYLESDCRESECSLLARDLWNLMGGRARLALAPQARTAYSLEDWRLIEDSVPPRRLQDSSNEADERIDWADVIMPHSVQCVPSLTVGDRDYTWESRRYHRDPALGIYP